MKTIGTGVEVEVKDALGNEVTVFDNRNLMVKKGDNSWIPLEKGEIIITVEVDRTKRLRGEFYALNRQGDIHATPMTNLDGDPLTRLYKHTVEIKKGRTGLYVDYRTSCVKLLELYKGGRFRIWEIGLTMRGPKFFLSIQAVYDEQFYRDGGMVVLPALYRWQSLRKIVFLSEDERTTNPEEQKKVALARGDEEFIWPFAQGEELPENLLEAKNLEPVANYIATDETTAEGLLQDQGRILHWNECSGTGGIITPAGTAKIHCSKFSDRSELVPGIAKGQAVSFAKLVPTSDDRTKFQHEAVGIKVNGIVERQMLEAMMSVLR